MRTQPDIDEFRRIAQPGSLVPVWREVLADTETPVSAYLKLVEPGQFGYLLESVEGGEQLAHYSFVGTDPHAVVSFTAGQPSVVHADRYEDQLDMTDPLDLLVREFQRPVLGAGANLPRFIGGAVGFLGYECAGLWERLPQAASRALDTPDAMLMFTDTLLAFDHLRHRVLAISTARVDDDVDGAWHAAQERIDGLLERLAEPLDGVGAPLVVDAAGGELVAPPSNIERAEWNRAVLAAKEHIAAGDIIQAVLSQRWDRPIDATPLQVYRALRQVNPSPYMYLLELGELALVGASPEMLVQVQDRRISTHPIAGTRRRGADATEDEALARELLADEKERAEHVMLVDLARNDIGRVSQPGSVEVSRFMHVERFSRVMHICTTVAGTLRDDLHPVDALRACFPAGTVSGAPKIRAMEIIADLEPDRRGPYAGAVGYFGYDGNLDTAIAIRTIVLADGIASVQAGAGIVADSDPDREFEETVNKASAVLSALDRARQLFPETSAP